MTDNEFVHTGDSAIATLGSSDMIFGTEPTYPNRITIARNHIREVGICTRSWGIKCWGGSHITPHM